MPLGDLGRQRFDGDLAGDVLEHAALLDAGGVLGALELDRDLGLDRLVELHLLQVDVLEAAADRVQLLLLDHDRDRFARPRSRGRRAPGPRRARARTSRSATWKARASAPPRVDDAGHEALAAQAARGARAELRARSGLQGCACAGHRTGEDRETGATRGACGTLRADGRRLEDPEGTGPALGQAGLDRRRAGRPLRRHQGGQRRPLRGGRQGAARAAPPRDGDEDGRRARPDEGRGDEARPVRLLHRHRVHPRGVPRDLPGAAGEAAHRRAGDALGEGRRRCSRRSTTASRSPSSSPSSSRRRSPPPRSARCTGPSCSTAARSR